MRKFYEEWRILDPNPSADDISAIPIAELKQTQALTSTIREYVEFVIQDYNKPMGVVTYKTSSEMPEKLRKAMPDIEELKKLL